MALLPVVRPNSTKYSSPRKKREQTPRAAHGVGFHQSCCRGLSVRGMAIEISHLSWGQNQPDAAHPEKCEQTPPAAHGVGFLQPYYCGLPAQGMAIKISHLSRGQNQPDAAHPQKSANKHCPQPTEWAFTNPVAAGFQPGAWHMAPLPVARSKSTKMQLTLKNTRTNTDGNPLTGLRQGLISVGVVRVVTGIFVKFLTARRPRSMPRAESPQQHNW